MNGWLIYSACMLIGLTANNEGMDGENYEEGSESEETGKNYDSEVYY